MYGLKRNALTNDQLHKMAPAIFATAPKESTSHRYEFIPTIKVLDLLRSEGWFPVMARQTKASNEERKDSSKHVIRLRQAKDLRMLKPQETVNEVIITNAHDATTAYGLDAGAYRCVCSNQMTVSEDVFSRISIRHQGFNPNDVIEASYKIIQDLPKLQNSIELMKEVQLSKEEQFALGESAIALRWNDPNKAKLNPMTANFARRQADQGNDLWHTFNRIQENIVKGGLRTRQGKARAVTAIDSEIKLNKGLWSLAEMMKTYKTA